MARYRVTVTQTAVYFVDAYSPHYAVRKALSLAAHHGEPAYRLESSADCEPFPEPDTEETVCRTKAQ